MNTKFSQKAVTLFLAIAFSLAIPMGVTFHSESFVVVAQDPRVNPITNCFNMIGETKAGSGDIQNWTKVYRTFIHDTIMQPTKMHHSPPTCR